MSGRWQRTARAGEVKAKCAAVSILGTWMTYSNHPTRDNIYHVPASGCSRGCACCSGARWRVLHVGPHLTQRAHERARLSVCWIFVCPCTCCKLYPQFIVHHSLHCSWENCSSRPSPVNQLWVKPRRHLTEQSLNVTVTVFHLSWQFVFQWGGA